MRYFGILPLILQTSTTRLTDILNMRVAWDRLIRFVATDGRTLYGEPILPSPTFDIGNTTEETGLKARVFQGDLYDTTGTSKVTDEVVQVKRLLGPLAPSDVPILRCVGLNYATHSKLGPQRLLIKKRLWREVLTIVSWISSSRSRQDAASVSFHLLQAFYDSGRS